MRRLSAEIDHRHHGGRLVASVRLSHRPATMKTTGQGRIMRPKSAVSDHPTALSGRRAAMATATHWLQHAGELAEELRHAMENAAPKSPWVASRKPDDEDQE
jgi:hypothetical protein